MSFLLSSPYKLCIVCLLSGSMRLTFLSDSGTTSREMQRPPALFVPSFQCERLAGSIHAQEKLSDTWSTTPVDVVRSVYIRALPLQVVMEKNIEGLHFEVS